MLGFALTLAATALASSSSSSSSSTPSCNVVKASEAFLHAMQANNAMELHSMYARNALRYDNGVLSRFSNGKPWSVAQHECVAKRVNTAIEVTHFTRDWAHRSASLAMKVTFGSEAPLDILVNLEFNRHDCTIENEHYYYATEHPGYGYLVDQTVDDCWGDSVDVRGPMDNVLRVRECWGYLIRGESVNLFMRCFNEETKWTVNGADAPAFFWDAAYWQRVFDRVDIIDSSVDFTIVQDRDAGVVSALVTGKYKTSADGPEYPFATGQRFTFEGGQLVSLAEIEDDRLLEPWMAAVAVSENPESTDLLWNNAQAKYAYKIMRTFFGSPSMIRNTGDGTGFAMFNGPANVAGQAVLGCLEGIVIRDEALLALPVLPTDQPQHYENTYAQLKIQLPESVRLDVQKVSRSVVYDAQAGALEVRGDAIQSIVTQLYLAKQVAMGKLTLAEAQANLGPAIADSVRFNDVGDVRLYRSSFYSMADAVCA